MISPDGRFTLIFNGEIYNYIELRQELIQRGVRFRTFSDTEVLLRLFEEEGPGCVRRLNGMFAFAVWDRKQRSLFAARDHFGIKPLYYSELNDGSLVFASEIKALLRHPDVKGRVADHALNEYFTFQFCLNGKTLFDGVKRLPPAHVLEWRSDEACPRIKKYWEISYEIDTHHTEEYFTDKLLLLLQDSVSRQLRSDVPLGAYLSGGLDSSVVTSLASSQLGAMQCFTGRFAEGKAYDESEYAKAVAGACGCSYNEIVPSASDFIELLPHLIYHMDEPAAGPGLFPQYLVSSLAKDNVTVVLGGQGGDELFGGYARYQIAYLEQCLKGAIYETQEEGRFVVTLESLIPNLPLLKQYVPMLQSFWGQGLFEPMDLRYFRLIDRSHDIEKYLSKDCLQGYDREAILHEFRGIFDHPESSSYFNRMTYFDQQTLLQSLLQVEDRVSMAVSLESRVPMLDPRIVELMASVPPTMKFKGGETKYLLKKAVGSLVPDRVMKRKDKMGFPVPLKEWWQGPLKEFVQDTLLSKRCRDRGLFDAAGLERLIFKEGRFGRQIWGALCLELWFEIFIDGEFLDSEKPHSGDANALHSNRLGRQPLACVSD